MTDNAQLIDEYEEPEVKCIKCKCILHGDNAKDVGYCIPCFNEMMVESDEEDE